MYRSLLVPLDGSEFALRALPPALSLAERARAHLHLATVVSSAQPFGIGEEEEGLLRGWLEEGSAEAKEYLERIRTRVMDIGSSVPVDLHVLSGSPAAALDELVRSVDVDLMVMTTHGRGGLKRLWLGSVADGLIRRAPCPILLWRPAKEELDLAERPTIQHILVPLDGSEASRAIIPHAEALALVFDTPLSLVSVVPSSPLTPHSYLPHAAEEGQEQHHEEERLKSYLAQVAERSGKDGFEVDAAVLRAPTVAGGILDHAKAVAADVTALSTQGRGGVARMVVGSVADKVIRGGEGHVLAYRVKGERWEPQSR